MRFTNLCKLIITLAIFSACSQILHAQSSTTTNSCSVISLGDLGALNGFVPSPNDAWHQDISLAPVDPNSNKIITTSGDLANRYLHPDFSSVVGGAYGIPYTVVDSSQTIPVSFINLNYPDESDVSKYPIPSTLPIEGSPGDCPTDGSDRHAIIIDRNSCVIYELYQAASCSTSQTRWSASNGAMWDMLSVEKRPYGDTSVDAAGLSVFEGLVRYDEVAAGAINHAIRFTANHTKADANNGYFTAPATHAAGTQWGTDNIIGMRIRLRADFDISGFSPTNRIILAAMKKYGMILADNGSDMFFQGTPDARWNDNDLNLLKAVPSSAFEVVQMNPIYDSETAPSGPAPVISSFAPSQTSISKGQSVTLTAVSDGSYSFIDQTGFTRGITTVAPTVSTTYTLTSRSAFGTSTATTTVYVDGSPSPSLSLNIPDQQVGAVLALAATSNSTGAITYSVASGPASLLGNILTVTGVGAVTIQVNQASSDSYGAATTSATFQSTAIVPFLAFNYIANQNVGAASFAVSTTSPSTGVVTYGVSSGPATISGRVVTVSGPGQVILAANQVAAGNYASATASTSFLVSGSVPALVFDPIADQVAGASPFAVSATSNSPGAITYSVVSGPATISGNTVTLTGVGRITLLASQAASGTFASTSAVTAFQVTGSIPTLVFNPIGDQVASAGPFAVSVTSNSLGAITYSVVSGPATISGSVVTLTGVGRVALIATQAASGNFAGTSATTSFQVTGSTPTLVFVPIAGQTAGGSPFIVSATSNSSGAITYSVLSGPATIVGNLATVNGLGSVTLQASQAAAGTYTAATATATFIVTGVTPALMLGLIADQVFGVTPFAVSAVSTSPASISYTIGSGPATISGNLITLTGAGRVTVVATQVASGSYLAASASTSFNVSGATPSLSIATIPDQTFGAGPITATAISNSPGAISYAIGSGPATISGNTITLTGAGRITVVATQAASGSYLSATASTSFNVAAATPKLSLNALPDQMAGGTPLLLSATSDSPGTITYAVLSGPGQISGNTVAYTGPGVVTVEASQAATSGYSAATAKGSFTVQPLASGLRIAPIPTQIYGAAPASLNALSSSSGQLAWSVLNGPATLAGSTVATTGGGTVVLQVVQAASGNYAAATATTSFAVQDFNFDPTPNISVDQGGETTATLGLSALNGFAGSVQFLCNIPAQMVDATCSSTNVDLGGSSTTASSTITIRTVKSYTASVGSVPFSNPWVRLTAIIFLLLPLAIKTKHRNGLWLTTILMLLTVAGVTGCGVIPPGATPKGTYTVQIVAASGITSHTTAVTVAVQ